MTIFARLWCYILYILHRGVKHDKEFKKLWPGDQQKVAIASDVIMSLKAKRINTNRSTYVLFDDDINLKSKDNQDLEVRDVIKDKKCSVCALGAMFISAIDIHDSLKVRDSLYFSSGCFGRTAVYNYLQRFFSEEELTLIEIAFEGSLLFGHSGRHLPSQIEMDKALEFNSHISNKKERMIMIMLNIIANNGKFIP